MSIENCCNESDFTSLDLSPFHGLGSISISPQSCRYVTSFAINGMKKLESVVIGEGSFTMCTTIPATSTNNAFVITNCPKLKTIAIASNAFMDWGEFQLKSDD